MKLNPFSGGSVGGKNVESFQRFTPEQMQLFKDMFGQVGPDSYLARLAAGDPELMAELERQGLRDFGAQQGNLASRFSGMGDAGRHSSGHALAQTQASQEFAEKLQGQRAGLRQQAIKDLFGLSNELLGQDPYHTFLQDPKKKWWESAIGAIAPVAGTAIGSYFGNPAMGAQAGQAFGNAFGGN